MAGAEPEKPVSETNIVEGQIQLEGQKPCPPEAAKEECPSTFGPLVTDTAIPIETGQFAIQPTFGLSFTTNNFTQSWRSVSAGGDFKSFSMPWKFTYGPIKNLEVYVVIPYIHNWAGPVNEPGPNNQRYSSFDGLGDISLTFKYQLVQETETLPTVSAFFTPTFPSGHAGHLLNCLVPGNNPAFELLQ